MYAEVCGQIEAFLRTRRYKLTNARKAMIRILTQAGKPLTAQEVHQRFDDTTADLASIYRSINLFCELGILIKLDFHDNQYRYELSDTFVPHHHHLICTNCGDITNVFEPCLPKGIEETLRAHCGFAVQSHILEFYGICKTCADSSS